MLPATHFAIDGFVVASIAFIHLLLQAFNLKRNGLKK
jgi:hypothetical protein